MDNNIKLMPYSGLMPGEPIIMPYQAKPFNGDTLICEEFIKLRDNFGITTAIECGSAVGGTTKWLSENFEQVYATEINNDFRQYSLKRTVGIYVDNLYGDSVELLPPILELCNNNTLLFLDDHWLEHCPLLDELAIIAASGLKPVIAVHDFLVPDHPEFGYDEYNGQAFTFEWLKPHFDKIYGEDGYDHYYNTGIVEASAKRGILYVTPKN